MTLTVRGVLRRLEVIHDGTAYNDRPPTKWGNRDIWPVLPEQRRFNQLSYWSFWIIAIGSPTSWSFGGSAIALGLSPGYAIGAIIVSVTIVAIVSYLCGHAGSHLHLGYVFSPP
jgi:NCS1 family nucleobase:cation symporter-1